MDLALALGRATSAPTSCSPTTPTPTGCAVAVPDAARRLAAAARRRGRRAARPTTLAAPPAAPRAARSRRSIVSSPLLGRIADAARRALRARPSPASSGSCTAPAGPSSSATRRRSATASTREHRARQGRHLRALLVAELGRGRKAEGRTLDRPCSTTSPRRTACTPPTSSRCGSTDLAAIERRRWRGCGPRRPPTLGGPRGRVEVDDLAPGLARPPADRRPALRLAGGARVIVRPSGTEPKLKGYLEVVGARRAATSTRRARRPRAAARARRRRRGAAHGVVRHRSVTLGGDPDARRSARDDGRRRRHAGRTLAAQDAARHVGVHACPRRGADPPALVVQVGKTQLRYRAALHRRPARDAAGARRLDAARRRRRAEAGGGGHGRGLGPLGGQPGRRLVRAKKGLRGRFGMYVPPVLEALGLAELEHAPRNNRMRAR